MSIGIDIEGWSFWCPEAADPSGWREFFSVHDEGEPTAAAPADLIPSMHRRRMSALSKMAVQAALSAARDVELNYAVFCSRHGELVRSHRLLLAIANGEELSPTEFSQSVHNTSSGLYSIITGSRAPTCSIASGSASFANAWMEAEGFLYEYPLGRVLLVDCDDRIPAQYVSYVTQKRSGYALALVLSSAGRGGVRLRCETSTRESEWPLGALFLDWWLSDATAIGIDAEGQRFIWER